MEDDPDRLRRTLEQAVLRICPRWLADQRQDLVQAALLKVVQVARPEESGPPASSYLWRVAHSAVMDEIRRRRRRHEVAMEDEPVAVAASGGGHAPAELREAIRRGLLALDPPRRSAVLLFLYGFSIKEAARIAGSSTKRADNERYRGLAELRRWLEERGYRP